MQANTPNGPCPALGPAAFLRSVIYIPSHGRFQNDGISHTADCNSAIRGWRSRRQQRCRTRGNRVFLLLPGRVPLHRGLLQPRTRTHRQRRIFDPQDRCRDNDSRGTSELRHLDRNPQPVARFTEGISSRRSGPGGLSAGQRIPARTPFALHRFLPGNPPILNPPRSPDQVIVA